jgi:hypothetical protein
VCVCVGTKKKKKMKHIRKQKIPSSSFVGFSYDGCVLPSPQIYSNPKETSHHLFFALRRRFKMTEPTNDSSFQKKEIHLRRIMDDYDQESKRVRNDYVVEKCKYKTELLELREAEKKTQMLKNRVGITAEACKSHRNKFTSVESEWMALRVEYATLIASHQTEEEIKPSEHKDETIVDKDMSKDRNNNNNSSIPETQVPQPPSCPVSPNDS